MSTTDSTAAASPIVEIDGLTVNYETHTSAVDALTGIDLVVHRGECLGIVGESGSGKSTLSLSLGGLLPANCTVTAGAVSACGVILYGNNPATAPEKRRLRKSDLAFVVQDPAAAFDPTMRIGRQIMLALRSEGRPLTRERIHAALADVHIDDPEGVCRLYPHEISGGMAQRVAIAMAIARRPQLLIADEPTAALDAEIRAEVLRLLVTMAKAHHITMIWVSHDMAAVRNWCDHIAIMHNGRILEHGTTSSVLAHPRTDYGQSLIAATTSPLVTKGSL